MNKILLYFVLIVCSHNLIGQPKIVSLDSIDKSILISTRNFAFKTYSSLDVTSFPKLSPTVATAKLLSLYNYDTYSPYLEAISNSFGALSRVELIEVRRDEKHDFLVRYKAFYTKTDDVSEIRVHLNPDNKFDKIIYKPIWFDKYYADNEKPPLNRFEIDSIYKSKAFEFTKRTFNDCSKGDFLKLTAENATRKLANSLTAEKLQSFCEKLTNEYGEVVRFDLIEVLSDDYRIIYRYKAQLTKTYDFLEFRVYTDMQHKFAGVYCKDKWFDKFYEDHEKGKD